jgi:hypothetical protein
LSGLVVISDKFIDSSSANSTFFTKIDLTAVYLTVQYQAALIKQNPLGPEKDFGNTPQRDGFAVFGPFLHKGLCRNA